MKRRKGLVGLSVGIIMFLAVLAVPFTASAGSTAAYPQGADIFFLGAVPPPGVYLKLYNVYQTGTKLKDNNGTAIPDTVFKEASAFTNTLRTIWITKAKVLGADYGMQLFVPWVHLSMDGFMAGNKRSETQIANLTFAPVILSWHFSQFLHAVFALDVTFPVGQYGKAANDLNIQMPCWTIEPKFGVSYFLPALPQLGFGALLSYAYNFRNQQTDVRAGDDIHLQWGVDYGITQKLRVGIGGYYHTQIANDRNDKLGTDIADSKTSGIGIGPGVWYQWEKFIFDFHATWDMQPKNNVEWTKYFLNITYTI